MRNATGTRRGLPGLGLLVALLAGVGCTTHHMYFHAVDDRLSVQVNVIGVSDVEVEYWRRLSIDDYWKPADPTGYRTQDKYRERTQVFHFGAGASQGGEAKLVLDARKNPVYKLWKQRKYAYVVILVDRPLRNPATEDCRRLIVPLDPDLWLGGDNLGVSVTDSCIELKTPVKAPAKPK